MAKTSLIEWNWQLLGQKRFAFGGTLLKFASGHLSHAFATQWLCRKPTKNSNKNPKKTRNPKILWKKHAKKKQNNSLLLHLYKYWFFSQHAMRLSVMLGTTQSICILENRGWININKIMKKVFANWKLYFWKSSKWDIQLHGHILHIVHDQDCLLKWGGFSPSSKKRSKRH